MEEEWWGAVLTRPANVAVGFFSLLLTRRGRVEEKKWRAGLTRLVKLAVDDANWVDFGGGDSDESHTTTAKIHLTP